MERALSPHGGRPFGNVRGVALPVTLRDDNLVPGLLVVRFGVVTLTDTSLQKSVEECHQRWGSGGSPNPA